MEAAARLAEGAVADRRVNLPILKNLLGDSNTTVRAASAVSLLLLAEPNVNKQIVAWRSSPDASDRHAIINQLSRVEDGRRLVFAREALEKLLRPTRDDRYEVERVQRLLARIP